MIYAIKLTGYTAEVIKIRAQQAGLTPAQYILSFFEKRCNAPKPKKRTRAAAPAR